MGLYLVMRNNLKRIFSRTSTYLCLFGIPLLIILSNAITRAITDDKIRIGLLGTKEEMEQVAAILDAYPLAAYEAADSTFLQTDLITAKYELIVDCDKEESIKQAVSILTSGGDNSSHDVGLGDAERMVAMAVTIYMVAASIFMAKICSDKKKGLLVRFAYAGNDSSTYFIATMLSTFIIVAIGMILSAGTISFIAREDGYSAYGVLCISFTAACLVTLVAGVFVILGRNEFRSTIMASSFAAVASMLGGTFMEVNSMPNVLQCISVISPVRLILFLAEKL